MPEHPLLQRAAQPTRDRIEKLAKEVPEEIRPLVRAIGVYFCDSKRSMTWIKRKANATEWHVRRFGRELGMTPRDLRLECRVETTLVLLRDTSMGIEEIAGHVGYKGQRGLERLFEALVGLPPDELRSRLGLLRAEHLHLFDKLFSWLFRVRHHRGELKEVDFGDLGTYLKSRFAPPEDQIRD